MGIIDRAIVGAAGAVKDASMEAMRAEILRMRDERLNAYADRRQEKQQAFEEEHSAEQRAFEVDKFDRQQTETERHNKATEANQRISAEVSRKAAEAKAEGAGTNNQKKMRELMAQGYPEKLAEAIAYDLVEKVQDPMGLSTRWFHKGNKQVVASMDMDGSFQTGPGWEAMNDTGERPKENPNRGSGYDAGAFGGVRDQPFMGDGTIGGSILKQTPESRGPRDGDTARVKPAPAPRDPKQRKVNQEYTAPDGRVVIWTGKGWKLKERQ